MGLVSYPPVDHIVFYRLKKLGEVVLMTNVSGCFAGEALMRCFSNVSEAGSASFRIRIEYILGLSATISIIDAPLVSHLNLPNFSLFVGSWYLWPMG